MIVASFVISVLALLASTAAIVYARRAANAADRQAEEARRQADAAHEGVRVAATPVLTVTLQKEPAHGPDLLYEIHNDGPKDLESVVVHRPVTADKVRYPIARLGATDFEDDVDLGPLRLGETAGLLLKVGLTPNPPEFRVRITCQAGEDTWVLSRLLTPRPRPAKVYGFSNG